MAVSEMSRRSRRRRAYPFRQPPEKAETAMEAHSTPFGNFRNLPKQTEWRSEPARQFPETKTQQALGSPARSAISDTGRDSQYVQKRPRSRLAPCRFFFFFFFSGNCRTDPKAQTSKRGVIISRRRPRIAPPSPLPFPWPPVVLAGIRREQSGAHPSDLPRWLAAWPLPPPPGQEEVITTQISRHTAGAREPADFAAACSALPAAPTPSVPPASALRSSFLSPSPVFTPFFSLRRPRTHRDKG